MSGDWATKVSRNYDQQERRKAAQAQRLAVSSDGGSDRQGDILGALGAPQAALKEVVLGDSNANWIEGPAMGPAPSITGVNISNPTQPIPERDYAPGANLAADLTLDPLNVVGAGVFSKGAQTTKAGIQAAKELFGPDAGKGRALSSLSNYIPNWYGPTDVAEEAGALDKALSGVMPNTFETPKEAQAALATPLGFVKWGWEGAKNVIMDTLDPKARALYKSKDITPGSQHYVTRALADNQIHKAAAQIQYLSHIGKQAGRVGDTASSVENVMKKSGVTDYFMYTPGGYKAAIKDSNLKPKQNGRTTPISDNDLDIIENHFGSVWKAADSRGNQVPFSESTSPILLVKAPGNRTKTGDHYNDLVNSGWITDMSKVFQKTNGKPSVEELWTQMSKNKNPSLMPVSDTLEKAKKNGIWLTGSKKGRAYTEGGINFVVNVKPNGNVIMVMSDEHNFFEGIAEKGDKLVRKATMGKKQTGANLVAQMDKAIPNRLVAVTPPMQANIFNLRPNQFPGMKTKNIKNVVTGEGSVNRADLEAFIKEKPTEEAVAVERMTDRGRLQKGIGAGMLTGTVTRERE